MMLLIDNDVIYKLAALGLLAGVTTPLRQRYETLAVLDALVFRTKRKTDKAIIGDSGIQACHLFFEQGCYKVDTVVTHPSLKQAMRNLSNNLDIGEMRLLQTLLTHDKDWLLTGDKRFLRGLVAAGLLDEFPQIAGRFICFEQLLLFTLKYIRLDKIHQGYLAAKEAGLPLDKSMVTRFEFEGKQVGKIEKIVHNLQHTVAEVRHDTGPLLTTDAWWNE